VALGELRVLGRPEARIARRGSLKFRRTYSGYAKQRSAAMQNAVKPEFSGSRQKVSPELQFNSNMLIIKVLYRIRNLISFLTGLSLEVDDSLHSIQRKTCYLRMGKLFLFCEERCSLKTAYWLSPTSRSGLYTFENMAVS
jgi:hypothetical protein